MDVDLLLLTKKVEQMHDALLCQETLKGGREFPSTASIQCTVNIENNQFLINTTLYVVSNKTQRFEHNSSSGVKVIRCSSGVLLSHLMKSYARNVVFYYLPRTKSYLLRIDCFHYYNDVLHAKSTVLFICSL